MAVELTQGEKKVITQTFKKKDGTAFDLTGSTRVTRILKADGSTELEIPSSAHSITDGPAGEGALDLDDVDTDDLKTAEGQTVLTIITKGGRDFYAWGISQWTVWSKYVRHNQKR